jgi:ABC-type Fe3+/spermidine/putrescine transport system ATPase subunit
VLLLDEPLSNLDPALRASTRAELRRLLTERRVTALFVTHDQEDAFAVADRVAILRGGRLLQAGTPEALYDRPASRAVAEFIGHASLVPARADGGDAVVALGGVAQRAAAAVADGDGRSTAGHPRGGAGWLAVLRPEQLVLAAAGEPGAWPGRVVARRFAGGTSIYDVACAGEGAGGNGAGEVRLEVSTPSRDAREGDAVAVRLARGPVALVPAAEG